MLLQDVETSVVRRLLLSIHSMNVETVDCYSVVFFLETRDRDIENSITAELLTKMNDTQVAFEIDEEEKQWQGTG